MSLVSIRNLRIEIAGVVVVDDVSLSIAPGECLAIVGESGSGKTLTARALMGLTPEGARVSTTEHTVMGTDVSCHTERQWRTVRGAQIGLVSQDALVSLDPLRRIGREIAEPLEVHQRALGAAAINARVEDLLARVAMPEPQQRARQYPHELSGGQRQRALIAAGLAAEPGLLIADEPTTALDSTVQARILELLSELKAAGLALLIVSHDLGVVAALADRIAVMHDGRILEAGGAEQVLRTPQHAYTRSLLASVPKAHRAAAGDGDGDGDGAGAGDGGTASDGVLVLSASAVSRSFRRPDRTVLRALDSVSLELAAGHTVGIVGESGSGKSTLARILLGIERPDSGTVLLKNEPWSALTESRRRSRRGMIQLIDQDPAAAFDPRFTVAALLREAVALTDTPRSERNARIRELLDQVGLSDELLHRRAGQLSGGQRQRVAIARALARRPEILICDEPVSALDLTIQAQILALLESLQQTMGLSLVVISHDLAVIRQLSDTLIVMKDGVVVEKGETVAVLAHPQHPFTRELLAASVSLAGAATFGAWPDR
jgi:peptide/nickel transport system ATP-binding protein